MKFDITERYLDGVVLQSAGYNEAPWGMSEAHSIEFAKFLPALAEGNLEVYRTVDNVRFVDGRVNPMVIFLGLTKTHEGTMNLYRLNDFVGVEGEPVYVGVIEEGGVTYFVLTTTPDENFEGGEGFFAAFGVDDLVAAGALLAGVDYEAEGLVTQKEAYEAEQAANEATKH